MMRGFVLALAASLACACVRLPVGTDGLSYDTRRAVLENVTAWQMRGRLAVDTGERGFQGSFAWRQDADSLELDVRGPLGAGVLRVAGNPQSLTVTARGETQTLTDPEAQLSELLGWWLPVSSLRAWLLGLPDGGYAAQTELGVEGTLTALDQRLWRVAYPAYQLAPLDGRESGVLVPRRIDLAHGELALRLTVDDWRVASTRTP